MNLDKLKALIRLANNNPSENEANLAARKVCKELASDHELNRVHSPRTAAGKMNEATFKEWTDIRTGDLNIRISNLNLHDNTKIIDLLRALKVEIERPRTWNDVRRTTEPQWRAWPPKEPKPPTEAEEAKRQEEKRKQHSQNYGFKDYDFKSDFDFKDLADFMRRYGVGHKSAPEPDDNPFYRPSAAQSNFYTGEKEKKRQEVRVCAKCGLEIMTYRIKENPWICNPCHWAAGKKEPIP